MQKFSQRELLKEGFLDIVRGASKAAVRGAAAATRGAIKTISPTGSKILSSAADAVGSMAANIIGSSPKMALETFLSRPENKYLFKDYSINKETKLPNGDRSIELTGEFINPNTQQVTAVTTSVVFRRSDKGGVGPETWKSISIFDPQTGQFKVKQRNNTTSTPSVSATPPNTGSNPSIPPLPTP